MHYRNGREAKNGDKIVQIGDRYEADGTVTKGVITAVGVLYDAKPGNDYCNGSIAPIQQPVTGACMCDCLHVDDVAAFLAEKGLEKRPAGK
jgi:S1-C subfamily serine protease